MDITRVGSQASGKGPADWFTGTVRLDAMFDRSDPARVRNSANLIVLITTATLSVLFSCDTGERVPRPAPATQAIGQPQPRKEAMSLKLNVKIGQKTFAATLEDNPATSKFRPMLPLTLDMPDLNANEKHVRLPEPLPTDPIKPGTIRAGDLLLWGDDTLVLFYKTFRSSYSYTRLGRINDAAGLSAAVGSGNVTVTFELNPGK